MWSKSLVQLEYAYLFSNISLKGKPCKVEQEDIFEIYSSVCFKNEIVATACALLVKSNFTISLSVNNT